MKELRQRLEVIARYPETPPSLRSRQELVDAARALARRALTILKKVAALDPKAARGIEAPLRLIGAATLDQYSMLSPQAFSALSLCEDLERACAQKTERETAPALTALARGVRATYGRMMTVVEYKRLAQMNELESAEQGQMIPAFRAPKFLIEKFLSHYDKTAIRNIYSKIGGTGNVGYVVFFSTEVAPKDIGSARRWPEIQEVKFPHGTPVGIVQVCRV